MRLTIKALLTLLVPCFLAVAYMALKINSGAVELNRWTPLILSNKNAMFFGLLVLTGGVGGYTASKQKTLRRKIAVNALTFTTVYLLALVLGGFVPFIGWVGY